MRRLPPDRRRQDKVCLRGRAGFDGHEVDFDEAMHRGTMYRDFEAHAREAECELLKRRSNDHAEYGPEKVPYAGAGPGRAQ